MSGKGTEKLPKLPTGGLFANGFPKLKSPSLKAKSGKYFFLKKSQIDYFLFNILIRLFISNFKTTTDFRDNLGHFDKANFWFDITMELCRIKANFFE